MTRAVITLKRSTADAMPILEKVIDGCAYNNVTPAAAFRYKNFGVIMHTHDILIIGAGNEAPAIEVMDFIRGVVANADEITEKVRTY